MSNRLFLRTVKVTLIRPVEGSFANLGPNAIEIENLRVAFSIEKTLKKSPNTCECVIYNLSERTRAEFGKLPMYVRIDAGHDGNLARIFTGDVKYADSHPDGPDWVTKLQLHDAGRAFAHARVNRSYKAGVNGLTVVKHLAETMGLSIPTNISQAADLQKQFATGVSVHGPAHREMTRVLKPHGYEWSVQDGRLQALKDTELRPDQAILVNESTGMVGSPETAPPKKKGQQPTINIRMLIYPGLTPGCKVSVRSRSINGIYKVERVLHTGDTSGPDWYSDIQAKPV